MSLATKTLHLNGLDPQRMAKVVRRAKRLGLTPEQYVLGLVDEDLAVAQEARVTTIDALMAPVRNEFRASGMSEHDLDKLVRRVRTKRGRGAKR